MPDTKLNQIVAIEKGVKDTVGQEFTKAYQAFDQDGRFQGISRTYTPLVEGDVVFPEESTKVQVTVPELVTVVSTSLTRMFDVVATKDMANTSAVADIVVGTQTLATEVPVTTLLWLEKQLVDLKTFIKKAPVLDPGKDWSFDPQTNWYEAEPVETMKTTKEYQNHILAEATHEHPAQVQTFTVDKPQGKWTTKHMSGAIPLAIKSSLLERVANLQQAVKFAREEANSITIQDKHIGEGILDYLFEPVMEQTAN